MFDGVVTQTGIGILLSLLAVCAATVRSFMKIRSEEPTLVVSNREAILSWIYELIFPVCWVRDNLW